MRLARALILSSMLVALSAAVALALTLEAPYWLVLPAGALVASLAAFPGLFQRLRLPGAAVTPIAIAAFTFSVVDFFYIGGSLTAAAADLMLILMCLKALTLRETKDYVQLYAASFFVLLASTGLSTEVYFALPFCTFFVSLTWALMLLTVEGDAGLASAGGKGVMFGGGFFAGTAALTLGSFAVTLAIFLVIPRVGMGFISKRAGGLLRTSGFSDTVELGSMGEVKLDPTVVMRVLLPGLTGRPEGPLYWRGRTFDLYDGSSWRDTLRRDATTYTNSFGRIYLRPGEKLPPGMIEQEISLEPLDTATIFALNPAYYIRAEFRRVLVSPAGGLFLPYPPGMKVLYTVYSATGKGSYRQDDIPGPEYLQLPADSAVIAAAAEKAAGDETGAGETAARIMRYLETGYAYSLNPPRDRTLSPIDDFLTKSRSGFCEHFATAMTLMLRARSIPARVVSGFAGGEWNGYGRYLLVRERDAHTWVEAYLPGEGWTAFDPTPESARGGGGGTAQSATIAGALDYLRFRWDRYIVGYSLRDQLGAAGWLSDAYSDLRTRVREAMSSMKSGVPSGGPAGLLRGVRGTALAAVVVVLFAALFLAVWRIARRRSARSLEGRVGFYDEMSRLLRRKGYERPAGKTPREFARSLPAGPEMLNDKAGYITEQYYRVRFGGIKLDGTEKERVNRTLDELKDGR